MTKCFGDVLFGGYIFKEIEMQIGLLLMLIIFFLMRKCAVDIHYGYSYNSEFHLEKVPGTYSVSSKVAIWVCNFLIAADAIYSLLYYFH